MASFKLQSRLALPVHIDSAAAIARVHCSKDDSIEVCVPARKLRVRLLYGCSMFRMLWVVRLSRRKQAQRSRYLPLRLSIDSPRALAMQAVTADLAGARAGRSVKTVLGAIHRAL